MASASCCSRCLIQRSPRTYFSRLSSTACSGSISALSLPSTVARRPETKPNRGRRVFVSGASECSNPLISTPLVQNIREVGFCAQCTRTPRQRVRRTACAPRDQRESRASQGEQPRAELCSLGGGRKQAWSILCSDQFAPSGLASPAGTLGLWGRSGSACCTQIAMWARSGELLHFHVSQIRGGCAPCWRGGTAPSLRLECPKTQLHLPLTRESSIFLRAGVGQGGSGLLTPSVVTTASRISAQASLKR